MQCTLGALIYSEHFTKRFLQWTCEKATRILSLWGQISIHKKPPTSSSLLMRQPIILPYTKTLSPKCVAEEKFALYRKQPNVSQMHILLNKPRQELAKHQFHVICVKSLLIVLIFSNLRGWDLHSSTLNFFIQWRKGGFLKYQQQLPKAIYFKKLAFYKPSSDREQRWPDWWMSSTQQQKLLFWILHTGQVCLEQAWGGDENATAVSTPN